MEQNRLTSQSWTPLIGEHILAHLQHCEPGCGADRPASFLFPPLRKIGAGRALISALFRTTPPFHESPLTLREFWRIFRGRAVRVDADAGTVKCLLEQIDEIRMRGPLSIAEPARLKKPFFYRVPPVPQVPFSHLPAQEASLALGLEEACPQTGLSPEEQEVFRYQWTRAVEAYVKKKQEMRFVSDKARGEDPFTALLVMRDHAARFLGTFANVSAEPGGLPAMLNETTLWSASLQSVVLSVALEFLWQNERFQKQQIPGSPHPLFEAVQASAQADRFSLGTVGDVIWMNLFLKRWLHAGDKAASAKAQSPMGLLLRNPVFVLENVAERLAHYAEDTAAQQQMLFFLATCSHAARKSFTEKLFEPSPEPAKDETPWRPYEVAAAWIGFLRDKADVWAASFEPHRESERENPDAARQTLPAVRHFLRKVVEIWEFQARRAGAILMWDSMPAGEPPATVGDLFDLDGLLVEHGVLCGADWPLEWFDGLYWLSVPTYPVRFSKELVLRNLMIPNLEYSKEE